LACTITPAASIEPMIGRGCRRSRGAGFDGAWIALAVDDAPVGDADGAFVRGEATLGLDSMPAQLLTRSLLPKSVRHVRPAVP
jgi:hypothetical protein